MRFRHLICVTALATAFLAPIGAQAFDDSKDPDLKGGWRIPDIQRPAPNGTALCPSEDRGREA